MFGALWSPFLLAPVVGWGPFGPCWKPLASSSSWSTNNLHYTKIATTLRFNRNFLCRILLNKKQWHKSIKWNHNQKAWHENSSFFNSIFGHQRGSSAVRELFYHVRQGNTVVWTPFHFKTRLSIQIIWEAMKKLKKKEEIIMI